MSALLYLRVLSPVVLSRVLAARGPSAIVCFPWARRMSHDEEELCQSCGQAVIPQMDGKVYKEHAVAGLEILSPRNLLSLSTTSYFYLPVKPVL